MRHFVFVYGTLKSGHGNHGVLARSEGAEFVGEFKTKPQYTMVSLGGFPGVIAQGSTAITGELWSVQDIRGMDALEGHPSFYQRTPVELEGYDGEAEVYLLDESYLSREHIPSGVWEKRRYG